jgi:hypothetical protein
MPGYRRGFPLGIDQDNLYLEDAKLLAGGCKRAHDEERREEPHAGHEIIVPS